MKEAMKPQLKEIKLNDVIFDEVIYPRHDHDPVLVQRYAGCLDEIESQQKFISVSSDMKLLDGKHRWLAYQKRGADSNTTINAYVYDVTAPHDQLKLAAKLNSEHGWQLNEADKEATAKSLYAYGCSYEDIAETLSVGKKRVSEWLSRVVKDNKEKRDRKIFDMWLACCSTDEIAEACGCDKATVSRVAEELLQSVSKNQTQQSHSEHATDFDPPIYNIWKQQTKSEGSSHFGNSETRWVDNLLYLYTSPFDVVVDPFAGGGSTIDICKKRFRRYFVSDRKPIIERAEQIRQHDLTDGLPKPPQWKDVKLVYLDPPYWKQAEGQYSNDPTDLANMTIEQFNESLAGVINGFAKKLTAAHIALIIQPTQWKAPDRNCVDHVADMIKLIKLPIDMRYSVPYESQQYNAQCVEWSKAAKRCLVLTREIIVWRVS